MEKRIPERSPEGSRAIGPAIYNKQARVLVKRYLEKPELIGTVLLICFAVFFEIATGGTFLSVENMRGILGLLPEVGLVAIGVTILMISGEFDLSVGSVFALAPMIMVIALNSSMPFLLAVCLALVLAAVIGLLNGLITLLTGIPSFITTLGMLFIARSLTVVASGGFPPLLPLDVPKWMFTSFIGPAAMFRTSFIWFVCIGLLGSILLSRTNLGNWIKATGGGLEAATSMGVPVLRVKVFCFMLCSTLAGLAGIIQVLRLGSPLPSLGEGLELQAIAAAVIGGTALMGGIGTVIGAIIGALLIQVIDNGLVLARIDANWFKFAIGALTILVVIAHLWLGRVARGMKEWTS